MMNLSRFATEKYRWHALVFLALGLAIVIIDTTVLNVAIPYILKDLNTSLDAIQWVISGYSLIIATLLITVGRLGDLFGRKKIFLIGAILFAAGSYLASIAPNAVVLFIGEAVIEAIGAAMMMTSSLALLITEFKGKERALAFGIWGSVAGASAALGPLLGGYLTTYFSWRWSLRINVLVVLITILGSVFIKEAKGREAKHFDWEGTLYSGLGLFSFVFGLIEGNRFGWIKPVEEFALGNWRWPLERVSVIPFAFLIAFILLLRFIFVEYRLEKQGRSPLLKLSMFKNKAFSMGLGTLAIVSLGQFGIFFVLTLFLQNVLGFSAFEAGLTFLWTSGTMFVVGPTTGFLASKFNPRYAVNLGMIVLATSLVVLMKSVSTEATMLSLAPGLVLFGAGIGMATAQLTNIILSSAPPHFAGEASAVNTTVRQVGTSIGIAIIGVVLTSTLAAGIPQKISGDGSIPQPLKQALLPKLQHVSVEQDGSTYSRLPAEIAASVKNDINEVFVIAIQRALTVSLIFTSIGAILSFTLPLAKQGRET